MYSTTRKYIADRAIKSGISLSDLQLHAERNSLTKWEIEVVYNGKDDEQIYLGNTSYEINICDWIAENVATEATIEAGIDSEPHWWSVRLYNAGEPGEESALYERNEDEYGPVLCSSNAGGDPGNGGCDRLVTGHDLLCTECRYSYYQMMQTSEVGC